jgi:hypothetical protein
VDEFTVRLSGPTLYLYELQRTSMRTYRVEGGVLDEILSIVFGVLFLLSPLPIGALIAWPHWKISRFDGYLNSIVPAIVAMVVIIQPLMFYGGSRLSGVITTFLFAIVPVLIASFFNPLLSNRFLNPWKLFCYSYALVCAFNVYGSSYLAMYGISKPALLIQVLHALDSTPWTPGAAALVVTLFLCVTQRSLEISRSSIHRTG